jgi:hypothetical protein
MAYIQPKWRHAIPRLQIYRLDPTPDFTVAVPIRIIRRTVLYPRFQQQTRHQHHRPYTSGLHQPRNSCRAQTCAEIHHAALNFFRITDILHPRATTSNLSYAFHTRLYRTPTTAFFMSTMPTLSRIAIRRSPNSPIQKTGSHISAAAPTMASVPLSRKSHFTRASRNMLSHQTNKIRARTYAHRTASCATQSLF